MVDNGSLSGPLHIQTEAQAEAIAEQTIGNNVILSFIFNNKELKKKTILEIFLYMPNWHIQNSLALPMKGWFGLRYDLLSRGLVRGFDLSAMCYLQYYGGGV